MQLNSNGLLAKFYLWTFGKRQGHLPSNFCNYFWALLFAILILPLTILSLVVQTFLYRDNDQWHWLGRILASAIVVSITYGGSLFLIKAVDDPWFVLYVLAAIAVICITIILCAFGAYLSVEGTREAREIVSAKIDSVKNEYCPKINWK